jgi:hypothetical protein
MFLAMFMRIALFWNQSIDSNERTLVYYRFKVVVSGNYGTKYYFTLGGLFLIYKSTSEIREKVDIKGHEEKELGKAATKSFQSVLLQII